MRKFNYILAILFVFCTNILCAQDVITMNDLPYFCDFEDDAENAKWVLNPAVEQITTANRWVVGSAVGYMGGNALYVSADNGLTDRYTNTNNVLLAYRDISLDRGTYDVAFDWIGKGNTNKGYLKVVFESRPTSGIKCLGNSSEPSWVSYAVPLMGRNTRLEGSDVWQHVQAAITIPRALANDTETRIFFVWVNTDAPIDTTNTSVVIDNFQLAKASSTGYPGNIHVTTSLNMATISWDGNADSYEILYRKKTDNQFASVTTDTTFIELPDMDYGAYEFWICGVNGTDKTIYTIFPVVYIYETDCFDALNMYNATFEYGRWTTSGNVIVRTINGTTRVDYGAADARSRHTTHFDTTEIDPRTIIRVGRDTLALRTVPSGEFGSVRVGNWQTGSQYESISFQYTVESDARALLLLKYAIVLQNPNHSAKDQPRFTLDIKDEDGKSINTKCASVDFHAPTQAEWTDPEIRELWHESTSAGSLVHWQDWKTIGINLDDYVGRNLTITITSYDCDQSGHFGYAYFTLKCSRTDVDGLPFGNDSQTQLFTVPDGFNYAWFNRTDTLFRDTLSTERFFPVLSSDTNTYVCHATYPTNPECGFVLDASAKPHNPVAEIQYEWVPRNCVNGIVVRNACHIGLTNQETGVIEHRYDKRLDDCRWTLPDGTVTDSLYYDGLFVPVPDEGTELTYKIWTGIFVNDSLFQDSTELTISVPAIGPLQTHFEDTICQGQEVEFPVGSLKMRKATGVYADSLLSLVTGCDSTVLLHLEVIQPVETVIYDTICSEGEYWFVDRMIQRAGDYTGVFPCISTGCDSVVTLHLAKAEKPRVVLPSTEICGDEDFVFSTEHSEWVDSFAVVFPEQERFVYPARQPMMQFAIPNGQVRAGRYTVKVLSYMSWCSNYVDTCSFVVNLPNTIVVPVFDDLFGILTSEYNGGYDIVSYQWYADGEPVEGATGPNFFDPNLNFDTEYTVSVQLADGTSLWICPFTYNRLTPVEITTVAPVGKSDQVRMVDQGSLLEVPVSAESVYAWYSLTGQHVGGGSLSPQTPYVSVPSLSGAFLLRISNKDSSITLRFIIV